MKRVCVFCVCFDKCYTLLVSYEDGVTSTKPAQQHAIRMFNLN